MAVHQKTYRATRPPMHQVLHIQELLKHIFGQTDRETLAVASRVKPFFDHASDVLWSDAPWYAFYNLANGEGTAPERLSSHRARLRVLDLDPEDVESIGRAPLDIFFSGYTFPNLQTLGLTVDGEWRTVDVIAAIRLISPPTISTFKFHNSGERICPSNFFAALWSIMPSLTAVAVGADSDELTSADLEEGFPYIRSLERVKISTRSLHPELFNSLAALTSLRSITIWSNNSDRFPAIERNPTSIPGQAHPNVSELELQICSGELTIIYPWLRNVQRLRNLCVILDYGLAACRTDLTDLWSAISTRRDTLSTLRIDGGCSWSHTPCGTYAFGDLAALHECCLMFDLELCLRHLLDPTRHELETTLAAFPNLRRLKIFGFDLEGGIEKLPNPQLDITILNLFVRYTPGIEEISLRIDGGRTPTLCGSLHGVLHRLQSLHLDDCTDVANTELTARYIASRMTAGLSLRYEGKNAKNAAQVEPGWKTVCDLLPHYFED